jgi:ribosomal protein L11 methyltransferase
MNWQEISISVPHEFVEPISYLFTRYGNGLAMERDSARSVLLRTYLPDTSIQSIAHIDVGIRLMNHLQPLSELNITPLPNQDWQVSWKTHFSLFKLGMRLVVKPTWIEYKSTPEEVIIEIDPGMAFGTGYHPTTHSCLESIERLLRPGMRILDLGTGSGILTVAAIKLGATHAVALDVDPLAVRAARQNFRRTEVHNKISLSQGTLPHRLAQVEHFDLAVANISAKVVRTLSPFIFQALKPGGVLIASGMTDEQQQEVNNRLYDVGFSSIQILRREDWATLECFRAV